MKNTIPDNAALERSAPAVEAVPVETPSDVILGRRLGGLLVRRECWTLSWKARFLGLALLLLGGIVFFTQIHSFLAITKPAKAEYLVVEGWIAPYAVRQAKNIFDAGEYHKLLTCGGPVTDDSGAESSITYGDWAASRLTRFGMSAQSIEIVRTPHPVKDRTYTSAIHLRAWFDKQNIHPTAINVVTSDTHGRRSRMLFEKAFGPEVTIGVISVSNPQYDVAHWWRSSAGVREILDETIAYVYALFFVQFSTEPVQL